MEQQSDLDVYSVGHVSKKNKTVICEVCNFKTTNKRYLSIHNDRVHLNIERFACGKCDYKSYFSTYVRNHQQNVHYITDVQVLKIGCKLCGDGVTHEPCSNIKPILKKCKHCTFQSLLGSEMMNHYRKEHDGEHFFNCDQCDYGSFSKPGVTHHKITMHREPLKCKHCKFSTIITKEMEKHFKIEHKGEKVFKCDKCDFGSNWLSHVKNHNESMHTSKVYNCD